MIHFQTLEDTFFASAHGTTAKVEKILGNKRSTIKHKKLK